MPLGMVVLAHATVQMHAPTHLRVSWSCVANMTMTWCCLHGAHTRALTHMLIHTAHLRLVVIRCLHDHDDDVVLRLDVVLGHLLHQRHLVLPPGAVHDVHNAWGGRWSSSDGMVRRVLIPVGGEQGPSPRTAMLQR